MYEKKTPQLSLEELLHQIRNYPGLEVTIKGAPNEKVKFADWAHYWLETWHMGRVKDNTYEWSYCEPVEVHLIPYFGEMYLHEITPSIVQEFFCIKSATSAMESLKRFRICLKGIFDTAIENGKCEKSPLTSSIRLWSTVPETEKQAWTQEQYDRAYQFAWNYENGVPFLILMETGISRSELLGLTWQDFDGESNSLSISNGLIECKSFESGSWTLMHDGLKNRYRKRIVPISKELARRIKTKPRIIYVKDHGAVKRVETTYICHSPMGKAYSPNNWYRRKFVPFMQALHAEYPDIPVLSTHELRHTKATLLTYQGVDLYTVARMLGHRDLTMLSRRYVHDDLDAMRQSLGLSAMQEH